jgi:sugar phosphate isomerase/epimerase
LEVGTLVHPYEPPIRWTSRDSARQIAQELNKICEEASTYGISIAYHNHWYEFQEADGVTLYEHFVGALDPRIELQIDTYWVEVGGNSSTTIINKYRDRITSLHLKDGPISMDDSKYVALGRGVMPIGPILDMSRGTLRVVELDGFTGPDVFDPVQDSLLHLRNFS